MSWSDYLLHGYYTGRELESQRSKLRRLQSRTLRQSREKADLQARVDELEDGTRRMSLLLCALIELGLRKGTFDAAELGVELERLDLLDGELDGKLDPDWMKRAPEDPQNEA